MVKRPLEWDLLDEEHVEGVAIVSGNDRQGFRSLVSNLYKETIENYLLRFCYLFLVRPAQL